MIMHASDIGYVIGTRNDVDFSGFQSVLDVPILWNQLEDAIATVSRSSQQKHPNAYRHLLIRAHKGTSQIHIQIALATADAVIIAHYLDTKSDEQSIIVQEQSAIRIPIEYVKKGIQAIKKDRFNVSLPMRMQIFKIMKEHMLFVLADQDGRFMSIDGMAYTPSLPSYFFDEKDNKQTGKASSEYLDWYDRLALFNWGSNSDVSRPVFLDQGYVRYAEIKASLLQRCFELVYHATGDNKVRPVLRSVLMQFTEAGTIVCTGTDGYRLAQYRYVPFGDGTDCRYSPDWKSHQFVLHKDGVAALLAVLKRCSPNEMADVYLSSSHRSVIFRVGHADVLVPNIQSSYPDIRHVIPADNEYQTTVVIEKSVLLRMLRKYRQGIKKVRKNPGIQLHIFPSHLVLLPFLYPFGNNDNDPDDIYNQSEVVKIISMEGKPITINTDARFLYEAVHAVQTRILAIRCISQNRVIEITSCENTASRHSQYMMPIVESIVERKQ